MNKSRNLYIRLALIICIIFSCCYTDKLTVFASGNTFQCWKCHKENSRESCINCPICGWDMCKYCGACKVGGCSNYNKNESNISGIIYVSLVILGLIVMIIEKLKSVFCINTPRNKSNTLTHPRDTNNSIKDDIKCTDKINQRPDLSKTATYATYAYKNTLQHALDLCSYDGYIPYNSKEIEVKLIITFPN